MTHTQESTPTLQPCPFCGGEVLEFMPMPAPWGVICRKCGAETCLADTKAEAIAVWNRRAAPTSQSDEALVEELARTMSQQMFGYDCLPNDMGLPYGEGSRIGTLMRCARAILPILTAQEAAALSALSRRVEELEVALQVAYDYARLFNRPTDAAWNEAEKMILAALKEIPDAT